jgi:branched-chain amino acid aminotransferase
MKIEKIAESRWNEDAWKGTAFGSVFSDHMLVVQYKDGKWLEPEIKPYGTLDMFPALHALHYGQSIFEGMKAYKSPKNETLLFRPEENAKRLNKSAARLCMPEIPEEIFLSGLNELIKLDEKWVPNEPTCALYIRPFMFASSNFIKATPSDDYTFIIITCPVQAYYTGEVHVKVETDFTRAAPGGTGAAKAAGNYAASFYPAKLGQAEGFQQLIWTDGDTHEYIEESGTMNIFFRRNNELVTPPTSDSILAGITRNSLIKLAEHLGITCVEEHINLEQMAADYKSGAITEAFGAGTAATVATINSITYKGEKLPFTASKDSYAVKLRTALQDLQYGRSDDPFGWIKVVS